MVTKKRFIFIYLYVDDDFVYKYFPTKYIYLHSDFEIETACLHWAESFLGELSDLMGIN